jgi:hypothetical protein
MVWRIRQWIAQGVEVRIVTARVNQVDSGNPRYKEPQIPLIELWCVLHVGFILPIQWGKSAGMIELWDDKVVRVEPNTGRRLSPSSVEKDEVKCTS